MTYDGAKPADIQFISAGPADMRENQRALKDDKIVNAGKLNDYVQGNANGNIPVSNGTLCTNLNAEKLGGQNASAYATSGHGHSAVTTSTNGFMSNTDKTKLDGISTGAQVNQNAFSSITVSGQTTIQADNVADTVEFVAGTNITLTTDATNDKIAISHTSGDGNLHVPATGTSNNAKVLKAGSASGSIAWGSVAASEVVNTPSGNILATNIQAAITELDLEKMDKTGGTFTGDIGIKKPAAYMNLDANAGTNALVWFKENSVIRCALGYSAIIAAAFIQNMISNNYLFMPNTGGLKYTPDNGANNYDIYHTGNIAPTGIRQSILSARVDANGLPNYLSSSGLALTLNASSANPFAATIANGFSSNGTPLDIPIYCANNAYLSLPANATKLVLAGNGNMAYWETWQYQGALASPPLSPIAGQIYFDTTKMRIQVYNGSSWVASGGIPIALVTTNDTEVTNIEYIPICNQPYSSINQGSAYYPFSCADGITAKQAVNKSQLDLVSFPTLDTSCMPTLANATVAGLGSYWINFSEGSCFDDSLTVKMIAASMTKKLDALWAEGTGQGGLDKGTKATLATYHCYNIQKPDGTNDFLFSLSPTAPTMPNGYTYKRRVGSVRTDSNGVILGFIQTGDCFYWSTPIQDFATTNPSPNLESLALTVPMSISVYPILNFKTSKASATITTTFSSAKDKSCFVFTGYAAMSTTFSNVLTHPNGSINYKSDTLALSGTGFVVTTYGYIDKRGVQ